MNKTDDVKYLNSETLISQINKQTLSSSIIPISTQMMIGTWQLEARLWLRDLLKL